MPEPTTPGRRRGAEKPYVPFNARPKEVGTFTGKPMPKNVPRNSDGFEDPDEFFKSPNDAPSNRSLAGGFARTPGTVGRRSEAATTPGTSKSTKRGRMSQLNIDDDSGEEFAADLLVDDDEIDLGPRATPGPFFSDTNPPPSVSLPRKSQINPASPSVDYDTIPSPSKYSTRKSTISATYSSTPNKATASASQKLADVTGMSMDIEDGSIPTGMNEDEEEEDLTSGRLSLKSKDKRKNKEQEEREDQSMDYIGDITTTSTVRLEDGRDAQGDRMSLGRRSLTRTNRGRDDDEDQVGDVTGVNVTGLELDDDHFDAGVPFDDGGAFDESLGGENFEGDYGADIDAEDEMPIHNGRRGRKIQVVHEDEEDDMKEAEDHVEPLISDEHDEDEEQQEERNGRAQGKNRDKRSKKPQNKVVRQQRVGSTGPRQVPAVTKRSRASGIGVASDENQYDGDFQCRRSGRRHFAPLAWWRGERFEYRKGNLLPEIAEVVHVAPEPTVPLAAKNAGRRGNGRSGRSVSVRPSERGLSVVAEEEGWDDGTDPIGLVREYPSGREVHRRIALPRALLNPKQVKDHNFMYQKIFGEDVFVASGVVFIPVGGNKPGKPSKDNAYMFYVIAGAVQVVVHKTSFVMSVGGQFMVPRGNHYSIENVSPHTQAQLFFAQARKIRAHEDDVRESVAPSDMPPNEEEEEEEERQQPVKKRKAVGSR